MAVIIGKWKTATVEGRRERVEKQFNFNFYKNMSTKDETVHKYPRETQENGATLKFGFF